MTTTAVTTPGPAGIPAPRRAVSRGSDPGENDPRRWKALGLLATAQFMVVLDASIVNIALPDIGNDLGLGASGLTWIITAYVIAFGGLLPLGGRLADLLGRRAVFSAGVGLFSAASLAAGLAPEGGLLIATRGLQGAGAALLAPAALSLLLSSFRQDSERAKALGIWGAVAAGGAAAGVLVGGLLTGALGWRAVFLINVPVGLAVLALVRSYVVDSRHGRPPALALGRFDLPGAALVTAGLSALVAGLSQAGEWGWDSPSVLGLLAAGATLLASFLIVEARGDDPLVPLRLFRLRTVAAGNAVMLLTGAAMLGLFYFLSLYEQIVLGYGPVAAGLSQLPLALALIVAAGTAAPLMTRFGSRNVLAAGLLLLAGGLAWFGLAPVDGTFFVDLLGPSLVVGIGLGAAFVPLTAVAVTGVPDGDAGVASGLVNTSQQIGGALGLAALATIATTRTGEMANTQAAVALASGYSWAFYASAAIAAAAAALALFAVRHDEADSAQAPTDHQATPAAN